MACRRAMDAYVERYGCQPRVMFLQNHGVITIGDAPSEIREIYAAIRNVLEREYAAAGIDTQLAMGAAPSADQVAQMAAQLRTVLGGKYAAEVCASGPYPAPAGPIMPDHILHCRSYHLSGDPTPDAIARFHSQHGHLPFVISCDEGVFGTGPNQRAAALALQFSQDGAQIIQLAKAFGGIRYMDDRARDFIENWEVEAYRRKLVDDARGPNVQ
jgi:rhamnose utilization protein RhaD (predicted bifunctional aldolase and dehydrogenase)